MRKKKFEKDYNINLDNVNFMLSKNGLYEFSPTYKGVYIIKEKNDYRAVEEMSNLVCQWGAVDLKGLENKSLPEKEFYKVSTTFLYADSASNFYYDTAEKAQKFLDNQINGEITKVKIRSYDFNYYDGCYLDDLICGDYTAYLETEI